jgi:hypothetical protein
MNISAVLIVIAIICDWILIGIFYNDYRKTKDRISFIFVLGLFFVFLVCIYFLLEKLGLVIVI